MTQSRTFTKKTVSIYGTSTCYWEKFPEAEKSIVLLHGFPGNHMGLLDLARSLGKEYRLLLPDMPACGASDCLPTEHTLEHYADWLHEFLQATQAREVVIIGHSFGARVALVFAGKYPEVARKVVLVTPVVKLEGLLPRIASLKGLIAKLLPRYMQRRWLSNKLYQYAVKMVIFKSASPKRKEEIFSMDVQEAKNMNVQATIEIFDEFYRSDITQMASRITIPCLVIAADGDQVVSVDSLYALVKLLVRGTLQVVKRAGHLLPLERPRATATIISTWLNSK